MISTVALCLFTLASTVGDGDPVAARPPPAPAAAPTAVAPPGIYTVKLEIDVPVIVVGASFGLVRTLFEDKLARKSCPCDPATINALDRGTVGNHSHAAEIAADVTVYGTMAALPLLDLLTLGPHRALLDDLVIYAETLAVDTALQNAVNFAVARPRPRAYAGDPAFVNGAEGYVSFYAGHVATAFSALSAASFTLQRRTDVGPWPWVVTTVIGGSVAFERMASGHHFPSDVMVAAAAGTTIGVTIPWLHTRARPPRIAIVPATPAGGLSLVGGF